MRLSQGHLNLLELCPRKFQHTYLEQLGSPNSLEQQEQLLAGSRFHALMQQWEMGLPIAPFLQEDPQLRQWFHAFTAAAPQILQIHDPLFRESEHLRMLEFRGHILTVVYDLLILTEQEAQILDWKTYPKPSRSDLSQSWQSRLYPFVLAETSEYAPEQISMTYWFFQANGETAQSLKLPYSSRQHEETRQTLTRLLDQFGMWLDRYETQGEFFPQTPEIVESCADCSFAIRCERSAQDSVSSNPFRSLAEIQEVPI
ncbi:PD-(D/E)XK nuclease family protein [Leptolyngbya sp. DQ-M1]|uniref:PD-(D/E)XK nuclease family protein n=1 Tax=Leptolyngbya sp. DQ-M1 TaxID=2933920 RepID=UPI00329A3957